MENPLFFLIYVMKIHYVFIMTGFQKIYVEVNDNVFTRRHDEVNF